MSTLEIGDLIDDFGWSVTDAEAACGVWYDYAEYKLDGVEDYTGLRWILGDRRAEGLVVHVMVGNPLPPPLEQTTSAREDAVQMQELTRRNRRLAGGMQHITDPQEHFRRRGYPGITVKPLWYP
jgi:hypothetical protein